MRTRSFLLACACIPSLHAQLINGSFEDALGNPSDSGWVASCTTWWAPGEPGFGDQCVLVPHGNTPGCGWSWFRQFVPEINDGETWTLSGWCNNDNWLIADAWIGFRFGIKDAMGNYTFNTAAVQNPHDWSFLTVTNSFSLVPGDTVFVSCVPGMLGLMGSITTYAMFDGVELTEVTTGIPGFHAPLRLHLRPDPVVDHLWVAVDAPLRELYAVGMDGKVHRSIPFTMSGNTAELDVSSLHAGAYVLWVRTSDRVGTERFIKL